MDVPLLSSGAINREHYNLVQNVEAASTLRQVDGILLHKVDDIRRHFEKTAVTSSECAPRLILLLYCWTATSLGWVTRGTLEFALPHAVTLAEAGTTLKEKRIGYLFFTEIMDKSDELQLMLVNTIRKDLEDPNPARVCLALDVLLMNCPIEAIPSVAPRLIDLLSHDSSHVKRKSMTVIRSVSRHEPDLLTKAQEKVASRLKDPDLCVVDAALRLLSELSRAQIIKAGEAMNMILPCFTSLHARRNRVQRLRLRFVEVVGKLISDLAATDPVPDTISIIVDTLFRLIEDATYSAHAFILEWFRTISKIPTADLKRHFTSKDSKLLSLLSRLINSHEPNVQFLCMTCLLELDVTLWAGVVGNSPSAFDENQVHTILLLLDSSDRMIRIKTLHVLNRVDREILLIHMTQLIAAFPTSPSAVEYSLAERALEVAAVYEQDGGVYGNRLRDVCTRFGSQEIRGKQKTTDSGVRLVSEDIVEQVLLHLRNSPDKFQGEFVDATVCIPVSDTGPTLALVIAAAVCQYGGLSTISQGDILRGLTARLEDAPPAIQEALLLSMLRVTARCGSAFIDVSDQVRRLHAVSRSHIRRRCDQYLTFSEKMTSLAEVVMRAKSDALPDFLLALEIGEALPRNKSASTSVGSEKSRSPVMRGKLRYEAYEPPQPAPKRTHRRSSIASVDSHATGSHSGRSDSASSSVLRTWRRDRKPDIETNPDSSSEDDLARTLTAGDLALAAHNFNFSRLDPIDKPTTESQFSRQTKDMRRTHSTSKPTEDLIPKADLITLDSPFLTDPSLSVVAGRHGPVGFEMAWDALKDESNSRGWSESSAEALRQRIQAMAAYHSTVLPSDLEPYRGEVKLVLSSLGHLGTTRETGLLAAVRIRLGEDGSALWQFRCLDATLKSELKGLLDDG